MILEYLGGIETQDKAFTGYGFHNDFRIPRRDWNLQKLIRLRLTRVDFRIPRRDWNHLPQRLFHVRVMILEYLGGIETDAREGKGKGETEDFRIPRRDWNGKNLIFLNPLYFGF